MTGLGKLRRNSLVVLLVLLVGLSLLNTFQLTSITGKLAGKMAEAKELARPAKIEITQLVSGPCGASGCYDIGLSLDSLKQQNVEVTKEQTIGFESAEGKAAAEASGVQRLPALIVSVEPKKAEQMKGYWKRVNAIEAGNGKAVIQAPVPPYYDVGQGKVAGLVKLIALTDDACTQCIKLDGVITALEGAGIKIVDKQAQAYDSAEGKAAIAKFGVTRVPAIVVSNDITVYEGMAQQLQALNSVEKDGYYVVHSLTPPYRDVASNQVKGLVQVVYLTDNSCKECFDVKINKQILQRFGLAIESEKTLDIASKEGKELLNRFNITKVPAFLASGEAKEYAAFNSVWKQVGTIEGEGWYVFRKPELFGAYKDLEKGVVVAPQPQNQGQAD